MSKKSVVGTTSVGILSSILAFLGIVSCCGMPIIAGILTWLGIGASQLGLFAAYRPVFIGVAIVSLLFGFWQAYFKNSPPCCTTSCCATTEAKQKPQSKRFQKTLLWIGAVVIVVVLIMGGQEHPAPQAYPAIPTVQVQPQPCSGGCPK